MDRFLQGFKDIILLFSFTGMLLVSGVSFISTLIIATIVGVLILVTPKEANQLKEILNGFKTTRIKKVTCRYRKM